MWKNSLKNVESDNNKILYETLIDFFYSETVITVWISLVHQKWQKYLVFVRDLVSVLDNTKKIFKYELFKLRRLIERENRKKILTSGVETTVHIGNSTLEYLSVPLGLRWRRRH